MPSREEGPVRGSRAYEALFARLQAGRRGAFVPFTVLGDPDAGTSLEIVRTMARSGADALELGLPFSDPVADGPAIQAAAHRALSAGFSVEKGWEIVSAIREELPALPIGLLVYANLVHRPGMEGFCARAAAAGVDSVLVADLPSIESAPFERIASARGIAPILIAPPNAGAERLSSIAARSRGYVYVTARPGVTGVRTDLGEDAAGVIRRLRDAGSAPPLLGFGISTPDHVAKAIRMGAAGAIAGSAIARIIEKNREDRDLLLSEVARFVSSMRPTKSSNLTDNQKKD